jgi:DegV family protein with EDD domain
MTEAEPIHFITDSTADQTQELVKKYHIDVVQARVVFDEQGKKKEYVEGATITREEFLAKIRESIPTTAIPGLQPYEEIYAAHPESIIVIPASKEKTRFYDYAEAAARATNRQNIKLIDTGTTSMGITFALREGLRLANNPEHSYSQDEIVEKLNEYLTRTFVFAYLDTMEYVKKGGRAKEAFASYIGTAFKLKPVILIKDNVISLAGIPQRTQSKSMEILINAVTKHAPYEELAVVYADNPDMAKKVAGQLGTTIKGTEPEIVEVNMGVFCHIGPGAIGVCLVRAKR